MFQVFHILLNLIGPVAIVAAIGVVWGYGKRPFDTLSFSMVATYVGSPCLVVDALANSGLKLADLMRIGVGSAACVLAALAVGYVAVRASRQSVSTYWPATAFANTGNIGLPLALFAFGRQGLGLAIAYFAVHAMFTFTVGQGLAARRFSVLEALVSPLIWATFIGAALSVTGAEMPQALARAVHILSGLTILMMLLALGVSLSQLELRSLGCPAAFSLLRLFGGFAIGWGVAWALGPSGAARGVLVIESAMPVAIYNYMFAARFDNRPEDVAGVVVLSTLLSIPALR